MVNSYTEAINIEVIIEVILNTPTLWLVVSSQIVWYQLYGLRLSLVRGPLVYILNKCQLDLNVSG